MRTSLLALALLAPPAAAGVLVVDPQGGPGTDFTSLSAAIQAAATGDILLLRSGTYDGTFVVGNKTLSIVEDAGAEVHITNSATGNPLAPVLSLGSPVAGTAVVRGLTLSAPVGGGLPLVVAGSSGSDKHVVLEDCFVPQSGGAGMLLGNGSPTIVARCVVSGADGLHNPDPTGFPLAAARPAIIASAGPLAMFGGLLSGGDGLDAGTIGVIQLPVTGGDGQPGLEIQNSDGTTRLLSHVVCIGGQGGDGAQPGDQCLQPGDGGDGVLVTAGGGVQVTSQYGTGNLPGTPAPGCPGTGEFGELLAATPPGEVPTWLPGAPAALFTSTPVAREGEAVTVHINGAIDQQVGLLIGFAPKFAPMPELSGVLVVQPALVYAPGPVDFTGSVEFEARVPEELGPGVEGLFAFLQVFSKNASGAVVLGGTSVVLMLDESF